MNNLKNPYWPNWPLTAAERIDGKNQILTSNNKDQVYCIWEVDKSWNYRKDRYCGSFEDSSIANHEKEFQVDIDNDGFINGTFIEKTKLQYKKYLNNNSQEILYKVDPIKMAESELKFKTKKLYKENMQLNIKLTRTGDGIYKTFPEKVSLNCGKNRSNCIIKLVDLIIYGDYGLNP